MRLARKLRISLSRLLIAVNLGLVAVAVACVAAAASMPSGPVDRQGHGLVRALAFLTIGMAAAATLLSILVGQRLARPLEDLTRAAARIGRGDLTTPVPRAPGLEVGTLAITMDETRDRLLRLTEELRRQQAEAEAILVGIAEGVFAVDRERRVRYLNPQAAALLGIRPAEALGRFCGDVLDPRDPGGGRPCEDRCPIVHARFRGSARATERLVLPGGAARTVVITSAGPAPGDGGGPSLSAGRPEGSRQFQVMRDETEVEAARRLRDAVLANISHEFRTPLTAQLASIEVLRDGIDTLSPDAARSLVLSLERGTLRLTQLIDNLLESVRIDAGRDSIRRGPVALDEVVEEAVEVAAPLVALRDQRLAVDLPYPLPTVTGDGPRLVQVFVNLLANANKFAPAGTTISIGGAVAADAITLWVQDQGPGFPSGTGPAIFDRFVRAPGQDDEEDPEQSGMGLGLWVVKSIVERHGGRLEVHRTGRATSIAGAGADSGPGTDPAAAGGVQATHGSARTGGVTGGEAAAGVQATDGFARADGVADGEAADVQATDGFERADRVAAGEAAGSEGTRMSVVLPRSPDVDNPRR